MSATADKAAFIALESQFWDAIRDQDSSVAVRLSDDPCVVVGPEGIMELDRKQLAEMMEHAPYSVKKYRIDEQSFQARQVSADAVATAYQVSQELEMDGKAVHLQCYDTSVWQRSAGGQWVCVMHTEAVEGDPLGLKRKQMEARA